MGCEREENQDAYGAASAPQVSFYFVCDGMGGHNGGSTAANMAVERLSEHLAKGDTSPDEAIETALMVANNAIFQEAKRRPHLYGMGTTAVVLGFDHETGRAHIGHVGDSRAYLLRGSTYVRLTRDHTLVQRLVDEGFITAEAAENHPNSNVISRSLGGRDAVDVEFLVEPITLAEGDVFLLCSDGLSGLVDEARVAEELLRAEPEAATATLIELARAAGGHDNITVVVARWGEAQSEPGDLRVVHIGRDQTLTQALEAPPAGAAPGEGPPQETGSGDTATLDTTGLDTSSGLTPPGASVAESEPLPPASGQSRAGVAGLIGMVAFLVALVAAVLWLLLKP